MANATGVSTVTTMTACTWNQMRALPINMMGLEANMTSNTIKKPLNGVRDQMCLDSVGQFRTGGSLLSF